MSRTRNGHPSSSLYLCAQEAASKPLGRGEGGGGLENSHLNRTNDLYNSKVSIPVGLKMI